MMDFAQAAGSWFDNLWGAPDGRPHERGPNGVRRRQYTGEELRAIRARNGVGRPPAVQRVRWGKLGAYDHRDEMMR